MSGFEIFAANPPPYLVEGRKDFSISPREDLSWLKVPAAARRAGYSGVVDLQLCRLESPNAKAIADQIARAFGQVSSGKLGMRYELSQAAAVEDLFLTGKATSNSSKVKAANIPGNPDFVILVPTAQDRIGALKSETFKKHVEKLKNAKVQVYLEVFNVEEAKLAESASVYGVIAKGCEADGLVGELTTFILVQQVTGAVKLPVIAYGGIGPHSSAACYAAGATGVYLTSQLWLAQEAQLPFELTAKIEQLDGSETSLIRLKNAGLSYRAYAKPNHTAIETSADSQADALRDRILQLATHVDPIEWILPMGQDVAFAKALASKFKSVAGILDAIDRSVTEHIGAAQENLALDKNSPLAQSHGTSYPIVQGAMTRVSDTADFAFKVAEGGGLPFLALALMRKQEVEKLLKETSEKLEKRPWGVGLLGFVPNQLRQEQLEAVDACKPDYALIAGGRPDQAKFLEDRGVKTYLHVPSPTLLSSFIEMGSRRFIFEGNECGGHIGPRSSFVLWESMIEELLQMVGPRDDPSRYHILFAGGLHDAKSATMVAAMAAPLTARGMKIGILMGTAYLFTSEAISSGAIVKQFQDSALKCDETVLLETGPGHAIRCMKSPYKKVFDDKRVALTKSEKSRDEIREELELMNLGRLRIASKGLSRKTEATKEQIIAEMSSATSANRGNESGLVTVPPEQQWNEGMYMIGQAASLRHAVITIKDLHENVSVGGTTILKQLDARREQLVPAPKPGKEPIAIVGMSCMFPKATDVETFWHNILNKVDAIEEVPIEQWDWRNYYDENPLARDKIYSKWGGFLEPVEFEPTKYGIPPASLTSIDPMQILLLEITDAALKDAGYDERPFPRERTSVVLANAGHGPITALYSLRSMLGWKLNDLDEASKKKIEEKCPEWTEDSFPGYLGNVTAGRVANRFDLGGINYSIDAACASSLAALHAAVAELRHGNSDVVLLSATDTHNQPGDFLSFSKTHAFSGQGHCRTFDASADGIVISEGMAMIVLKRLADAERDGDRIYAVIRGVGGSSDGRDLSLTAPRPAGQKLALKRAYEDAGVSPSTVSLVEAHGTGTVAGDKAEVEALRQIFEEHGAPKRACAIGSVKTMIGHTKTAAGLASLIKIAKALHHKVLPPTIGVTNPNPACNFEDSPFYISGEVRPWLLGNEKDPPLRRAGVSAFGFGGTNFHVVLEEYIGCASSPAQDRTQKSDDSELFVFQARNRSELVKSLTYFVEQVKRLEPGTPVTNGQIRASKRNLSTLARLQHLKTAEGRAINAPAKDKGDEKNNQDVILSMVASSVADLQEKLARATAALNEDKSEIKDPRGVYYRENNPGTQQKIAFLFPGQGSQYLNMLRDVTLEFPEAESIFQESNRILSSKLDKKLSDYIFALPSFSPDEEARKLASLTDTRVAQPAVAAADVASLQLMKAFRIAPDMVAGHSFGEYVALHAANVISFADLLKMAELRGRLLAESSAGVVGTMAAVACSADELRKVLPKIPGVVLANINSPSQTVIAGDLKSIEEAIVLLKQENLSAKRINVSQAFHTHFMEPAAKLLKAELEQFSFGPAALPVYSNVTGKQYSQDDFAKGVPSLLSTHTTSPVDFVGDLKEMFDSGARVFIEVGPASVLSQLASATFGTREDCLVLSLDRQGRNGRLSLLHLLAQLASFGVSLDLRRLFTGKSIARHIQSASAGRTAKGPRLKYTVTSNSIKPIGAQPSTSRASVAAPSPTSSSPKLSNPSSSPATDRTNLQRNPMSSNGKNNNGNQVDHAENGASKEALRTVASAASSGAQINVQAGLNLSSTAAKPESRNVPSLSAPSRPAPAAVPKPMPSAPIQPAVPRVPQAGGARNVDQVMMQFQQTMLQMTSNYLETQERVMLAYLQGQTGQPTIDARLTGTSGFTHEVRPEVVQQARPQISDSHSDGNGKMPVQPAIVETQLNIIEDHSALHSNGNNGFGNNGSGTNGSHVDQEIAVQPADTAQATTATEEVDADFLVNSLLDIVSQRTGYPVEMLDPGLDLEADLGIDSIKRVEILNSFRRILPTAKREQLESGIEDLAGTKTLQGIIDWLRSEPQPQENSPAPTVEVSAPALKAGSNGDSNGHEPGDNGAAALKKDKPSGPMTSRARDIQALTGLTLEALDRTGSAAVTYSSGQMKRSIVQKRLLDSAPGEVKLAVASNRRLVLITPDNLGLAERAAKKFEASGYIPVVLKHEDGSGNYAFDQDKKEARVDLTKVESLTKLIAELKTCFGPVAGLVHLQALQKPAKESGKKAARDFEGLPVYSLFCLLKSLQDDLNDASDRAARVLAVSGLGGDFGIDSFRNANGDTSPSSSVQAGLAGVIKTAKKEFDDAIFRILDVSVSDLASDAPSKNAFANDLLAEFLSDEEHAEIARNGEGRFTLITQSAEIEGDTEAEFELNDKSVVFVTGGARGITGDIVLDLATRFKPTFVIVGRSDLPEPEENWLQGLAGPKAIKSAVIEQMKAKGLVVSVPMVEAEYQRIMRAREVRHYLDKLRESGARFEYYSVDVRDESAVGKVVAKTYEKLGKIDLVLHGAGVIEDAYIKDKSLESFQRVFETKVKGAQALVKHLRLDSLERLVFFSSVVGRDGNAGQADYVAANEAVNKLARAVNSKLKGRAVSIMWGPWKGGMAQPELESVFANYGWAMIDIPRGCESFVEEITRGSSDQPEVMIVAELTQDLEVIPRGPRMHESKVRKIGGGEFEFNIEVGAAVDLYLLDHTLDGQPVMPMAMSLELMAEAAISVYPGYEIAKVENLDIPAGIVFDTAKKPFAIQVKELETVDGSVRVLAELSSGNVRRRTNFRAEFVLNRAEDGLTKLVAGAIPPEIPRSFELDEAKNGVGTLVEVPNVNEIYGSWLFHGPRFQGIKAIHAVGTHGCVGAVALSSPKDNFLRTDGSPWLIDPIMLDSSMQLAGVWARRLLEATVLPTGIKRMTRFAPITEGPVTARVFMSPETTTMDLVCTLAIYNPNGALAMLIEGLGGVGTKSLNRLSNSVGVSSKK
jgi:acyl transferase domain-containing protein/NAD(P)H-dependent flavin oxidoreductase YrpB (nitropropane dioxygenase family)/NAD(P)-dependent dehydrogenase (short-subunit alcohol dehydrogenase family)